MAPAPPKAALGFPRPCLVAAVLPADSRRKVVPERPRSESLSWFSSLGEFEGSNMFKSRYGVNGVYKPTYNWGHHPVVYLVNILRIDFVPAGGGIAKVLS